MTKTDFKSVDEYIEAQPAGAQALLRRVRSTIKEAVPGAEEGISYQMPTYKLNGSLVLHFAGWKAHYSIYPATAEILEALKEELAPYKVEKDTIRFPLSESVPVKLIESIARLRAKDAAEQAASKPAAAKKR